MTTAILIAAGIVALPVASSVERPSVVLAFEEDGEAPAVLRATLLNTKGAPMILRSDDRQWSVGRIAPEDSKQIESLLGELEHLSLASRQWNGHTSDGPTYIVFVRRAYGYMKFEIHGILERGLSGFDSEVSRMRAELPAPLIGLVDMLLASPIENVKPYVPSEFFVFLTRVGSLRRDACPWPPGWPLPAEPDLLPPRPYEIDMRYRMRFSGDEWPKALALWSKCKNRVVSVGDRTFFTTIDVQTPGSSEWRGEMR
jgi:hypothetical protein